MAPLSESAFRSLLADCERSAFADFVAGLWRARGREGERVGDRIVADGRELRPVVDPDGEEFLAKDTIVVSATPTDTEESVGPEDLYHILLYDVPRERAAALFEAQFDRPLAIDSTAGTHESTGSGGGLTSVTGAWSDESTMGAPDVTTLATDDRPSESTTASKEETGDRPARMAHLLPRDGDDLQALVGDQQLQVVGATILIVLAASVWGLFLYQPDPKPSDPPFTVDEPPADGSYRAESQMHTTGGPERSYLQSTYTYVPGDPAIAMSRSIRGTTDDQAMVVNYWRGNRTYVRQTWTDATEYRDHLELLGDGEDVVRTSDSMQSIYKLRHNEGQISPSPRDNLLTSVLSMLPYERDGTVTYAGRDVVRYEPTTGWTARKPNPDVDPQTYRVRSASGEVLVDAETGALLYADVDATIVPAETWSDVLTEPDLNLHIEYRVETGVNRPRRPPWVHGLEATSGNVTTGNATVA